jgi:hypothetical protein
LQFFALPLIAEIGAALAGFATLAGIIRRDELDSDAIFAIVFNSLIAVVFALVGILFAGAEGTGTLSIRIIAGALLPTATLAIAREVNVYRTSWRAMPEERTVGGLGRLFGIGALVTMLPSPLLACAIMSGHFQSGAALLYELAVFSHLLVAIFLLLYVVWWNFALRRGRPE